MPAQSPTLSPTLSAMTAGLRGSSSGMPASTLPTRSAPTSAPLVKMPPPRRAKIEISEPPKASPTSACSAPSSPIEAAQHHEVAGDAEQAQAHHQHAGDGAAAECNLQRGVESACRRLARCARWRAPRCSCRCSRSARTGRRRPRSRRLSASRGRTPSTTNSTTPTMAIVVYWRFR